MLVLAAFPIALSAAILPQPALAAEEVDEIVVTGFSKPYKLTGKQLAAALKAYAKYRPVHAPQGRLFFEVKRRTGGRDLGGLRLSLRSGERVVPITLDAASRFILPALPGKNWELVANRGSGGIKISPLVLSPGSTETDRSLGDMRLQCEVTWAAFVKPELPFVLRGVAAAVNACHRSDFALMHGVDRKIAAANVVAGTSVTPIKLGATGMSFRYPGHDKALPNDARVRFRYD